MTSINAQEPSAATVSPQPQIKYYEADPADQRKASLTCHECKMTLDMTISKNRNLQYCPCCGKSVVVENS